MEPLRPVSYTHLAAVVRRIFRLTIEGKGLYDIVNSPRLCGQYKKEPW